jgi:hypothetical protein
MSSPPSCRYCGERIKWVYPRWRKGALPLDVTETTSTDDGLMRYTAGGHILKRAADGEALTGYLCHFDTCVVYAKRKADAKV